MYFDYNNVLSKQHFIYCILATFIMTYLCHSEDFKPDVLHYADEDCAGLATVFSFRALKHIIGRVNRASATEMEDMGSIPGWIKLKSTKLVFTAFLLDV